MEAILVLSDEKGFARSADIAGHLGVTRPSVTEMLNRLKGRGLVEYKPYSPVKLTRKGLSRARSVRKAHETLYRFLELLRVDGDKAISDACSIEHCLSPQSLHQINRFVEFMEEQSTGKFREEFDVYMGGDGG